MHDVTVTVPGHTFEDFIVDLTRADNSVISVLVTEGDGTTDPFQFTGGSGSNFVTVIASAGETIFSVDYSSTSGWVQFKEPRVSGISGVFVVPSEAFLVPSGVVVIPEPSTWAMMALGFAGLSFAAFRQGRKTSAVRRDRVTS
jgi:PEP-CTERM motif